MSLVPRRLQKGNPHRLSAGGFCFCLFTFVCLSYSVAMAVRKLTHQTRLDLNSERSGAGIKGVCHHTWPCSRSFERGSYSLG